MRRYGWFFVMALMALMVALAVAQDDNAGTTSGDDETAAEATNQPAEAESANAESDNSSTPGRVIRRDDATDSLDAPETPRDATPDPANTGAPLVVFIGLGAVMLAAAVFMLRRGRPVRSY